METTFSYTTTPILPQLPTQEEFAATLQQAEQYNYSIFSTNLQNEINLRLSETDWTELPDAPLTEEQKTQYQNYRQALRDLPQTATYDNLVWPVKPA